jgi:serine/threonine protein phosphatase 1
MVMEGVRVYAVGDIHGRADLLEGLLSRIDAHAATCTGKAVRVFLGDYIDRGPNSREVLDLLIARRTSDSTTVFLKGNHEACLLEFLQNPSMLNEWRSCGGLETLVSYGLRPSIKPAEQEQLELARELEVALPKSHREFLGSLALSFTCGEFFFVHAGVKPGLPLGMQTENDLLWIRDEFLMHEGPFGKTIVHGHTPVAEPDFRANRINIDTGAYATGRLTCVAIERDTVVLV